MFKLVNKNGSLYTILDTNDGVQEVYTYNSLVKMFTDISTLWIEGLIFINTCNEGISLLSYELKNLLYDGAFYRVIYDSVNDQTFIVDKEQRINYALVGFWISRRSSVLRIKNLIKGDVVTPKEVIKSTNMLSIKEASTNGVNSIFVEFPEFYLEFDNFHIYIVLKEKV